MFLYLYNLKAFDVFQTKSIIQFLTGYFCFDRGSTPVRSKVICAHIKLVGFSCSVSLQEYHVPVFAHSPSVLLLSLLGGRGHRHRHPFPPLVCCMAACMAEKAFLDEFCKFKVHRHFPLLHPHSGSRRGPCNWSVGRGCSQTGTLCNISILLCNYNFIVQL